MFRSAADTGSVPSIGMCDHSPFVYSIRYIARKNSVAHCLLAFDPDCK